MSLPEPVEAPEPAEPGRRPDPLLAVVAGVAAGVVVAVVGSAQPGLYVIAASLGVGALLRALLRPRSGGLLVVRSRRVDVAVLAGLAAAVATLAAVTPFPTGKG